MIQATVVILRIIVDALDEIQRMVFSENSYYRSSRRNLALLNVIEKVCISFMCLQMTLSWFIVFIGKNSLSCSVMAKKISV